MDRTASKNLSYSLIIPLFNEEENLKALIEEIEPVMTALNQPWELICIDDGSQDRTRQILEELIQKKPYLRGIFFDKNYGQSSAFSAGFDAAKGAWVITMDGDRQNDPKDIPALISKTPTADLIVGWRVNRQDTTFKKSISKLSNAIRSRLCKDGVHDTGCSLKVMRKEALEKIPRFKGMHRFLPAFFVMQGFKVQEVPVNHRKRILGSSKYHFFNRLSPIIDLAMVWWLQKRWTKHKVDKELM